MNVNFPAGHIDTHLTPDRVARGNSTISKVLVDFMENPKKQWMI
jgi:hypothetical protein